MRSRVTSGTGSAFNGETCSKCHDTSCGITLRLSRIGVVLRHLTASLRPSNHLRRTIAVSAVISPPTTAITGARIRTRAALIRL
jgi:hypothetical protein